MAQAWQDIQGMFGLLPVPVVSAESVYYLRSYGPLLLLGLLGATPLVKKAALWLEERFKAAPLLRLAVGLGLLLVCTGYLVDGSFNPFLYFRF